MKYCFSLILTLLSILIPTIHGVCQTPPSKPSEQNQPITQEPPPSAHQIAPEESLSSEVPISYKGAFAKMMLTLLGLIFLIVLSVWFLRRIAQGRFHQMNQGRAIKILERRPLSAKSVLYVVEINEKKVVIAESQLEVRTITTVNEMGLTEED